MPPTDALRKSASMSLAPSNVARCSRARDQNRLDAVRAAEVRTRPVGEVQVGARQRRLAQIGATHVGARQIGAFEVRALEVGALQVGEIQVRRPGSRRARLAPFSSRRCRSAPSRSASGTLVAAPRRGTPPRARQRVGGAGACACAKPAATHRRQQPPKSDSRAIAPSYAQAAGLARVRPAPRRMK